MKEDDSWRPPASSAPHPDCWRAATLTWSPLAALQSLGFDWFQQYACILEKFICKHSVNSRSQWSRQRWLTVDFASTELFSRTRLHNHSDPNLDREASFWHMVSKKTFKQNLTLWGERKNIFIFCFCFCFFFGNRYRPSRKSLSRTQSRSQLEKLEVDSWLLENQLFSCSDRVYENGKVTRAYPTGLWFFFPHIVGNCC